MLFPKYKIISPFGARKLANGDSRQHNGIDVIGIGSTKVLSPIKGVVMQSRIITDKSNPTWEWGEYIAVKSADGFLHYFCHLADRSVKLGQSVDVGQSIGTIGNTGYSFGAHVHYGIKNTKSVWINPLDYYKLDIIENKEYVVTFNIDYRAQVQKRFDFDENTMKFLDGHPYHDVLFKDLAIMK